MRAFSISTRRSLLVALILIGLPRLAPAPCAPDPMFRVYQAPPPNSAHGFGSSVAISNTRVIIGADTDRYGADDAGRAYAFDTNSGQFVAVLNNPGPTLMDYFGYAVAFSGNVAAVGAFSDDPGGVTNAGAVYLFNPNDGSLLDTILDPSPEVGDYFGVSVAMDGGLLAVGAPGGAGFKPPGCAYVFNVSSGDLVATLNNPNPASDNRFQRDEFGASVAISGNLVVVGTPRDDPNGTHDGGRAYVFNATTGGLIATLDDPSPGEYHEFGWSVGISEYAVVVGSGYDDEAGAQAGAVHTFDPMTGLHKVTLDNPSPSTGDLFGDSVGISGRIVLAGASGETPSPEDISAGSAYFFNANTGELILTFTEPEPVYFGEFGRAVSYRNNAAAVSNRGEAFSYLTHNSVITEHTIPNQLALGQAIPVRITACNTGLLRWSAQDGCVLLLVADSCGSSSGTQVAFEAGSVVDPGNAYEFSFTLAGAGALGACNLQYSMARDGVPFGEILSLDVEVVDASVDSELVGHTIPEALSTGQGLWVGVTMKNVGSTMWHAADGYALGVNGLDECGLFSVVNTPIPVPTSPGQPHQFLLRLTAPATPSNCTFTLQMREDAGGWFGDDLGLAISIIDPPNSSRDWHIYE